MFNIALTRVFKKYGLALLPPPLVGMFAIFFSLLALPESAASGVVSFFKPGVDLITRFLPMFFVPALVVLPLSASGISGDTAIRALGVVIGTMLFSFASTAGFTTALQNLSPQREAVKEAGGSLPGFSGFLQRLLATCTLLAGALSVGLPAAGAAISASTAVQLRSLFMGLATTFGFVAGTRLPARLPAAVNRVWHPLMSATAIISALIAAYGAASNIPFNALLKAYLIPGGGPLTGAGNLVMYFLGPAIWSFGFGLYGRRKLLGANLVPILGGTMMSAGGGIVAVAAMCRLLAPDRVLAMALLPRATAALAVIQAGMMGASAPLVTANCVVTGMLAANFAKIIMGALHVDSACARGVATGGAGFSLGTAALAKDDPEAFPFGALGMALMSTWTTCLYAIPAFRNAILSLAGML